MLKKLFCCVKDGRDIAREREGEVLREKEERDK